MVDQPLTPVQKQTPTIQQLTEQLGKMTALNHALRQESERRRLALHAVADSLEGAKSLIGKKLTDALVSIAKNARDAAT
jgi:hypothetical protein